MPEPYAELIGDPVAHSLSPAIHVHWLAQAGLAGSYRVHPCSLAALPDYLRARRADPAWRGCNVTMPLKRAVFEQADLRDATAMRVGAANCLTPSAGLLNAHNTDVAGIAAALAPAPLHGAQAVVIGAGGAARAAVGVLAAGKADVTILARHPDTAGALRAIAPDLAIAPMAAAAASLENAALIINASPLGMTGAPRMPDAILEGLSNAHDAFAFDMVYRPVETPFLAAARAAGLPTADGLDMLIGQAREAFALFFGKAPPPGDAALKERLLRAG